MKTWLQGIEKSASFPWILGVLYAVFAGGLVWAVLGVSRFRMEQALTVWIPWNLRIAFLLLILGLFACRDDLKTAFRSAFLREEEPARKGAGGILGRLSPGGIALLALLAVALILVVFATVRTHRIFFDEDIYANMAQTIAAAGKAGICTYGTFEYGEYFPNLLSYNKDPSGWPFLISLVFQLFGTNELFAFLLNNLVYGIGILIVFFIARTIGGGTVASWFAAAVFALTPHNLIWSNTLAAEPPAALFGGIVALLALLYARSGEARHLFLLAAAAPLACTMRPESGMILFWAAVALLALRPELLKRREFWAMGLMAAVMLAPHVLHTFAVSGESWGAAGPKFSLGFFAKNIAVNGPYYLNNAGFPAIFSLLAVLGLLSRGARREKALLLLWFVPFWGIFLFFYAGSYKYGADVRFALLSLMPLAVLAGLGAEVFARWAAGLKKNYASPAGANSVAVPAAALAIVVVFLWTGFLPLVRLEGQEAWGARCDHRFAREAVKKIPDRSIVLTHVPTMFLVWGRNAISPNVGISDQPMVWDMMQRYRGHVYFHWGYWCNTKADSNRQICEEIARKYEMEPVAQAREQDHEYGLYKIRFK